MVQSECGNWLPANEHHFQDNLGRAKTILEKNQYPSYFYEPIIERTLENIINLDSVQKKNKEQLDDI